MAGVSAYVGTSASGNRHAVPQHQGQRQFPLPPHRSRRRSALGSLVCKFSCSEHSALSPALGAGVIILSALGVNVSGLLLPAGVCLAIAAKDLAHNFLAGMTP